MQETSIWRKYLITVTLPMLTAVLTFILLTGCDLTSTPGIFSGSGESSGVDNTSSVSQEEAEAVAEKFAAAKNANDEDAIKTCLDMNAMCDTVLSQIDFPDQAQADEMSSILQKQISQGWTGGPDMEFYAILNVRKIDGEYRALARFVINGVLLRYHDLCFAKDEDGQTRIVDMIILEEGDRLTSLMAIPLSLRFGSTPQFLKRFDGAFEGSGNAIKNATEVMLLAKKERDFNRATTLYEHLPKELQESPELSFLYVQSLIELEQTDRLNLVLEESRAKLDNTRCIDRISIDYYLGEEEDDQAIVSMDRLYESTKDPLLLYLKGKTLAIQKKPEEALVAFNRAMREKPSFPNAGLEVAYSAMKLKKWQNAAEGFRYYEDLTGKTVDGQSLNGYPNYIEFLSSESGKPWQ